MYLQSIKQSELIIVQSMYQQAFLPIYKKYHDEATDPYLEPLASIQEKYQRPNNYFYFAVVNHSRVGMIRTILNSQKTQARISPLLILPPFQGNGFAQQLLTSIEETFTDINQWLIDTIAEEPKLVHLYEKMGYQQIPEKQTTIQSNMHIIFFQKERNQLQPFV